MNGAGATFPYPIYSKWFDEFHKRNPDVQINYQSIGSGGGIRQVTDGTVDFGASDGPMTEEQLAATKVPILHLPTVLGAVVPTFNLAGVETLRFTPEILAGIFLGKVTRWDDPAIVLANPGVKLPAQAIVPVHRSDGSGTTYVFTDYLTKVSPEWASTAGKGTAVNWPVGIGGKGSPEWAKTVGRNTAVAWPVGLGGKGNEGVTGLIKQTPNSIGYIELVYAVQNKLPVCAVRNRSGRFVEASLDSITAAAASAASNMPADFRVSITDAAAADAYPIASFTWLLVPTRIKDAEKGRAMKDFLAWMLVDGQKLAPALQYAPLPEAVIGLERQALDRITVGAT